MVSSGALNVPALRCCAQSSSRPGLANGVVPTRQSFIRADKISSNNKRIRSLEVQATNEGKTTAARSIVCAKCEGNGIVICSQCKGSGLNSEDHFNGRFKAGAICWLCSLPDARRVFHLLKKYDDHSIVYAEVRGKYYAETATELASLVDS